MWSMEIKNGDFTGRIINGSECLIQWLTEAMQNEGNAIYAQIGNASESQMANAFSEVILKRMEYLLSMYKRNPSLFLPSQVFINFSIVPVAEGVFHITLVLLNGSTAEFDMKSGQ